MSRLAKTLYVKIYDRYYLKFANEINLSITDDEKKLAIDEIFSELNYQDTRVLELYIRHVYNHHNPNNTIFYIASKISNIPEKTLYKEYNIAERHLMSPLNISIAVPGYYTTNESKNGIGSDYITKEKFGNKKYIVTALNRNGLYYVSQLKKHLSNGWSYLWTIPGIGDSAKQEILKTIDKLAKEGKW